MRYSLSGDFLNPKKVLYPLVRILPAYLEGARAFTPWAVEIHPTAKCNYRCIHCSYMERNESRRELDATTMNRLIDSLIAMRVRGVYFSGGGEPTVYPGLKKYIEKLSDNNVDVAIVTNGSLLAEAGLIDIAEKINYIAISVPSCNEENFYAITGARTLKKILAIPGIIREKRPMVSTIVGARVVVTNRIFKEVPHILRTLYDKGFDYAIFKVVRDYEERGLGLDEQSSSELVATIAKLAENNELNSNFTNLESVFTYRKPYVATEKCYINDMGMLATITPDGNVYPNISEIGNDDFLIGNLFENNFETIWNSNAHTLVKNHSNEQWRAGKCKNCRSISYNTIIGDIVKNAPASEDPFV